MADSVPYGLTVEEIEEAPPAAKAVAARLSHIVIASEWWGLTEISALFLNMAIYATWPRTQMWPLYHMVCRPLFEAPLFAGLDALERDPSLPPDQREEIRKVRDLRAWVEEENERLGHEPMPFIPQLDTRDELREFAADLEAWRQGR